MSQFPSAEKMNTTSAPGEDVKNSPGQCILEHVGDYGTNAGWGNLVFSNSLSVWNNHFLKRMKVYLCGCSVCSFTYMSCVSCMVCS